MPTTLRIDLPVDFNTMDETGLPWTFLDEAANPSRIVPGAHVIAGAGSVRAVVVVVDVTDTGIVHVCPLDGTVADNAHLLDDPSTDSGRVAERRPDVLPVPLEAGVPGCGEAAQSQGEDPGNTAA